jgi:hypothetical protein
VYWVIFAHIINSSVRTKQFAQVVCEKREFNFVFVHVVEYADVFADDGDGAILCGFIEQARVFDVAEVVVQNVHDGIALIVQLVQMRNARGDRRAGAQTVGGVVVKLAKPDVGAELVGQLQGNGQSHNFEFL